MTTGEQAVWAAEFVRHLGPNSPAADLTRQASRAAQRACDVVEAMRRLAHTQAALFRYGEPDLDVDARAMLDAMLGGGR